MLGANETIASKYPANEILVANRSKWDALPTGFYTQLHEASKNLDKVHGQALTYIHRDGSGQHRPELAGAELSQEGQATLPKAPRSTRQYDTRDKGRNVEGVGL